MGGGPGRVGSSGWFTASVAAVAAVGFVSLFVAVRVALDRISRDTAYDVCERSDLDLVRAAGAGDVDTVRRELEDRDPNERDRFANTALGCAIPRGRTDAVAALLAAGADPDVVSGAGEFADLPIELAHQRSQGATLTALLDHGADPDRFTEGQRPLLLLAAEARDDDLVATLLDHGADPTTQDSTPPLEVASGPGTDRSVELLLAAGAGPDGTAGHRPVVAAAAAGRSATIERLLAAGADLSIPAGGPTATSAGGAALSDAATGGHLEAVATLLAAGVDPNEDPYNPPLLRAVALGHREVAVALLDAGADPDAGETDRVTLAFTLATINPTLADRLRLDPVDAMSQQTTPGSAVPTPIVPAGEGERIAVPPLAAAVARGDAPTVELLLTRGADPVRATLDGMSPLVLAGLTCDADSARLLLAAGADPADPTAATPERAPCDTVRALLPA